MRASKRAAFGVSVVWAAWAAGCLLPTGHVELNAPPWCASAGPGAVVGDCEGGADGSFEVGSRPAPSAPGRRNPAINAVMTVTAYQGDGSVAARWRGPTRWVGSIPATGMMFTGEVNRGRVTWDRASAEDVRVAMKRDGSGGLPLRRWLLDRAADAMRVSVVVRRNGGSARDEVAAGMHGSRTHAGGGSGAGARRGASAAWRNGKGARGGAARAGERGADSAGDPRGARGGRGNASGDGRGRLRHGPRNGGDGSHVTGTRGGSPRGSGPRSSWVDEPAAALSSRGGRVPKPDGAEGGSPAGSGQPGDRGLSVGMPVFGGVISVPPSIAPALDVAAMLAEAGASPTALASKWIGRTLRFGVRGLRHEIGKEAAKHAERAVATTRRRLSRSMDFRRLSPAEQQRILDAMDDALRREYLARVEDGIAREIADIEETLPRFRAQPRNEVRRHIAKRLRDRLEAAQRVQDATRQAGAEFGPAPAPARSAASSPAARGSTRLLAQFTPSTIDDVVSSSARLSAGGRMNEGARAIAKKLGHAQSGGFPSAFSGITPTQANAEAIIRDVLGNPARTFYGDKVIDVYNAAGQGVRFDRSTGVFRGFLEASLASQ